MVPFKKRKYPQVNQIVYKENSKDDVNQILGFYFYWLWIFTDSTLLARSIIELPCFLSIIDKGFLWHLKFFKQKVPVSPKKCQKKC